MKIKLDDFKDSLFDLMNELWELEICDIKADDRNNRFLVAVKAGSVFEIECRRKMAGHVVGFPGMLITVRACLAIICSICCGWTSRPDLDMICILRIFMLKIDFRA